MLTDSGKKIFHKKISSYLLN